jgi:hypothetical protein
MPVRSARWVAKSSFRRQGRDHASTPRREARQHQPSGPSALLFLLESVKKSAVGEMSYNRPYLRGANRLSDDPL